MKRRPLLTLLVALAAAVGGFTSCEKPGGGKNTLQVSPDAAIMFRGDSNTDVVLTVTTNAGDWSYQAPEWVVAVKKDGKLTLNAKNNTGAFRSGKITISAGNATAVVIGVGQEVLTPVDPSKTEVSMLASDDSHLVRLSVGPDAATGKVYFLIPQAASASIEAEVTIDAEYVAEFDYLDEANEYTLFPTDLVTFTNGGKATIAAGYTTSSADIGFEAAFDAEKLSFGVNYLLPLQVKATSDNAQTAAGTDGRVNVVVRRTIEKAVRNICWMEINDGNPLNLLEYRLETGEPFFDALVMFSSNINYNTAQDEVFIHHNPNNRMLLDEAATFLAPLRAAGIKVYLSIMGNHDPAGIATLSDWGAEQFALKIAETVDTYNLDGVAFDDEYTQGSATGKWFAKPADQGTKAAARLCYESKKAMKEVCGEDKDVVLFAYGNLYASSLPAVDGHDPAEFVDIVNGNYGSPGSMPAGSNDKKRLSAVSIEMNRGYGLGYTEANARAWKEQGYGWVMWFALNAGYSGGKGYDMGKYNSGLDCVKRVCKGLYDKELAPVTHYYKKHTNDKGYDPERFAY